MYLLDVGRCKLPAIWYCQCCRDPDTCLVGCLSARVSHLRDDRWSILRRHFHHRFLSQKANRSLMSIWAKFLVKIINSILMYGNKLVDQYNSYGNNFSGGSSIGPSPPPPPSYRLGENIAFLCIVWKKAKLTPFFSQNVAYGPSSCTFWIQHCVYYTISFCFQLFKMVSKMTAGV